MIYELNWLDFENKKCQLIIENENESGDDVELTPSENPFITSEDSDSNPFIPVRTGSAKISFISDINGDYPRVYTSNEWRVTLFTSDAENQEPSNIGWRGYLKGESLSQPYESGLHEITINAVNDISVISSYSIHKSNGFNLVSLRELICECLEQVCGDDTKIYFADTIRLNQDDVSVGNVLSLKISRFNFFISRNTDDGEDYEGDSYLEILKKICTFFGWSLRQYEDFFIFYRIGARNYVETTFGELYYSAPDVSPELYSEKNAPTPHADGHLVTIENGYRKISVVANLNEVEDNAIPDLDFENSNIKWTSPIYGVEIRNIDDTFDGREQIFWKFRYLEPRSRNIVANKLYSTENRDQYHGDSRIDESSVRVLPFDVTMWNTVHGHSYTFDKIGGCHILSQDYFKVSEMNSKKNLNYKIRLILTSMMPCLDGLGHRIAGLDAERNLPLLEAKSGKSALYNNGGFEISFKCHAPAMKEKSDIIGAISGYGTYAFFDAEGEYSPIYNGVTCGPYLGGIDGVQSNWFYSNILCVFSVGRLYWDGGSWTTQPSAFYISCNQQGEESLATPKSNKTYNMNFVANDYVMPINQMLSGEITFKILKVMRQIENSPQFETIGPRDILFMEDLKIKYCPQIRNDVVKLDIKSNHYYSKINNEWTEDLEEVSLNICSNNNDSANYSMLVNGSSPLVNMYIDGNQIRPENALLDSLVYHFSSPRTILTAFAKNKIGSSDENRLRPMNFCVINETKFEPVSYSNVNWRTGEAEILLKDYE